MTTNVVPPLSLTILRQGKRLFVDLAEVGTLIPRSETHLDDAFLREVTAELRLLATPGFWHDRSAVESTSDTVRRHLQRVGTIIFSHLFPESVRVRLRTATPGDLYLRLDEQLLALPWELAYDGQDFLATRFRVGRQVITSHPLPGTTRVVANDGPLKVLLIADPTESLPQATAEVERLCAVLEEVPGIEVTLLGGRNVRKLSLLAAVQEHALVHFAGHSVYDPRASEESGWRLHEGILTARELGKLTHPPQLVFSNSCQAGASTGWTGSSQEARQDFGLGSAFLLAGVPNYIGPCWVVDDTESVAFALAFYQAVIRQSIGAALCTARQAMMQQSGGQHVTWASYLLYGDPAFTFLSATNAHSLPGSSTAEHSQLVGVLQRKLAAILSADVKGYSRLMGEDEVATIRTLTAYREVMTALIEQHRGRVVDAPGDNLLAEFASAVDAVQGAVEIQQALKTRNAALPPHRKMEFRIGLNVGDVIVERERIYGDGVNIAARLEALAEGSGICLSGTVYDQVKNKLTFGYEYVGEQTVKNIAEPVRVYRLRLEDSSPIQQEEAHLSGESVTTVQHDSFDNTQERLLLHQGMVPKSPPPSVPAPQRRRTRHVRTGLIVVSLLLVAGVVTLLLRSPLLIHYSLFVTHKTVPFPLKPSIAVLPFTNMSGDAEQEYFSDGMTDTLITDLSKLSGLFVIARNSTFAYKGKAIKPQQVSQELGVRYVVEGSVQKADTRVRINAQLVDAATGQHVWAERYDRELKDIFALQDDLTQRIVRALEVRITTGEQGRIARVPTENLEAYDYFLRGKEQGGHFTKEADTQAQQLLQRAITLDPQFALAYLALGWTYIREWDWLWSDDPRALDQALALAHKAIALNDSLAAAHSLLGLVYAMKGQAEEALTEGERAIVLDPNCADCYANLAVMLLMIERYEEALGPVEKAMRLDPESAAYHATILGWAYQELGRYDEAIAAEQRALTRNPNYLYAHTNLASIYNELGRVAEAQAEEAEVRRINPNFPVERLRLKSQKEELAHAFKGSFTENLQARAYFVGGIQYFLRFTKDANTEAQRLWEQAVILDPQFAAAHTMLGITQFFEWIYQWSQDPQTLEHALTQARTAVALDDSLPLAHGLLGTVYLFKKQPERALVEAERAIALDPSNGDNYAPLATILLYTGRPEEAVGVLEKALQLHPRFPASLFSLLGSVYYQTGRQADALDALQKALPLNPNYLLTHVYLAVIYSELGREEEARTEREEILRISPTFSLEGLRQRSLSSDPETERVLAALRKAGLK